MYQSIEHRKTKKVASAQETAGSWKLPKTKEQDRHYFHSCNQISSGPASLLVIGVLQSKHTEHLSMSCVAVDRDIQNMIGS